MNLFKAIALAGAAAIATLVAAGPARAQQDVDRADPAVAERELGAPTAPYSPADDVRRAPASAISAPRAVASFRGPVSVGAVVVDGTRVLRAADFASAIAPYLGRRLDER